MKDLPLSNKQKGILTSLARRAYKELAISPVLYGYEDWRRDEQAEVLQGGRKSLTEALQSDYVPLYNHFAGYAGLAMMEDSTYSPKDIAYHKLEMEIARQEISLEDVRDIAVDKFFLLRGYPVSEIMEAIRVKLDPRDTMHLFWTVKSRGSARTRKIRKEYGL